MDYTLPVFHPVEGLEVTDSDSIQWLLAGGPPLCDRSSELERSWAQTTPADLS